MSIELINNKPIIFRIDNINYQYVKPKYLMPDNEFKLIEAVVKGSTMIWNLKGKQVSYNQIKEAIKNN